MIHIFLDDLSSILLIHFESFIHEETPWKLVIWKETLQGTKEKASCAMELPFSFLLLFCCCHRVGFCWICGALVNWGACVRMREEASLEVGQMRRTNAVFFLVSFFCFVVIR
jgi:hypothetical protein